ncbi:hypothetical protein PAXRUDRAFT_613001 [Paxillus rubicundulus Ve08.2h10]|uniref:Uncharacterized protein n=1 Tax=Paxillus rubicundulus Ve08.2h10 TaxID=930991 RepID=A0A0D0DKN3_9AGAM|nr:hypothetical protein PAXRUDRAFT_613001 [Paxillus rubicundulus Ve08.2h10]
MDVARGGSVIIMTGWDNHDSRYLCLRLTTKPLSPHGHSISRCQRQVVLRVVAHVYPVHPSLNSQAGLHISLRMKNGARTKSLSNHSDAFSREKGSLSQLSDRYIKLSDIEVWLGVDCGMATTIFQYTDEDLEAKKSGECAFPGHS